MPADGWERRFVADPERAREAAELYRQAGFEVVLRKSYGRIFTWGYWLSRLANYPALVRRPVAALVKALGLESKFLSLDTRDSMEVVARRAGPG